MQGKFEKEVVVTTTMYEIVSKMTGFQLILNIKDLRLQGLYDPAEMMPLEISRGEKIPVLC